jgi:hypothetical protein
LRPLHAPVLQEVAARVGGQEPEQRLLAPDRWAYALRDAVTLARPDWVVTHFDPDLEAQAIDSLGVGFGDLLDADLAAGTPGAAALELTATLAALYPRGVVAASLTGPVTTVTRLAERRGEALEDLAAVALDCGDALAALAAEHVARGARRIIVWEPQAGAIDAGELGEAHQPLLRRLALLEVEAVVAGPEPVHDAGYARSASTASGRGAALLPVRAFTGRSELAGALAEAGRIAGESGVLLSDGPVPGECDLAALGGLATGIEGGDG